MPADPLWIAASGGAPEYNPQELRRAFAAFLSQAGVGTRFGARSGLHPASGNAVTFSNPTVTVNNLKGTIHPGITSLSGPYVFQLPTHTHPIVAAHATLARKDLIVVRVWDDDEDSGGLRQLDTEYVTGTAAASPAEPTLPPNSFRIATIDVPINNTAGATVTNNYPIAVAAGGVEVVRTDSELTGTASGVYDGMLRWNQATNQLQVHDGASTWETLASPSELAAGTVVAHLQRAAAQSLTNSTSSSTADAVSWDTEVLDRLACWAVGSNPTRYTPNVAGWYMFYGMVSFAAETTGTIRGCAWKKNGSPVDANVYRGVVDETPISGQGTTSMAIPFPMSMNGTTDYVELVGLHDASAALNTGTSGFRCSFTAVYGGSL
jgi:hypothetical protein